MLGEDLSLFTSNSKEFDILAHEKDIANHAGKVFQTKGREQAAKY